MLWFRNKSKKETAEYKDKIVENTCLPSDICEVMDCNLYKLRSNQAAQKYIQERIDVLQHKDFPMVYWWACACQKMGVHTLGFCNGNECSINIYKTLQLTLLELKRNSNMFPIPQEINQGQFNVEQFCKEIKDLFTADQQIAELKQEYNKLIKSEKRLKEILNIN